MNELVRLVYRKGLRGPAPEKWFGDHSCASGKEAETLAQHVLKADEVDLPLKVLQRIYKPPQAQL